MEPMMTNILPTTSLPLEIDCSGRYIMSFRYELRHPPRHGEYRAKYAVWPTYTFPYLLQPLGVILNQRHWWRQHQPTTSQSIELYLHNVLQDINMRCNGRKASTKLKQTLAQANNFRLRMDEWLQHVPWDEHEDEHDDPYAYVLLYMDAWMVHRHLRASLHAPIAFNQSDSDLIQATMWLITTYSDAVTTNASSVDTHVLINTLDGLECRPHVISTLERCLHAIACHVAHVHAFLNASLHALASNGVVSVDSDATMEPGAVRGTWISDDLMPTDLQTQFLHCIGRLEANPDEEHKNWRIGPYRRELELLSPALYCCFPNKTRQLKNNMQHKPSDSVATRMYNMIFAPSIPVEAAPDVHYQWIPSDVYVCGDKAQVEFQSYINNLHPATHGDMYNCLEAVISRMVPLFEQVLSTLATTEWPESHSLLRPAEAMVSEIDMEPHEAREQLKHASPVRDVTATTSVTIRNCRVQVMLKIAEIHVAAHDADGFGGELPEFAGREPEQIVAVGLYVFGAENIQNGAPSMRFLQLLVEQEEDEDEMLVTTPAGTMALRPNRLVVFPNTLLHALDGFQAHDPTQPAVLKYLMVYLVDPNQTILSTSSVPPQQPHWITQAYAHVLQEDCGFPAFATDRIQEFVNVQDQAIPIDKARVLEQMHFFFRNHQYPNQESPLS